MIVQLLSAGLIAWLPGALIYRLPIARRDQRAALPVEERVFWHVTISVAWSLAVVLALAAFDTYRFERLLVGNGVLCGAVMLGIRSRLGYRGVAPGLTWQVLLPIILIATGVWRFFPPSEFIVGGQDPGIYMNEGMQIAQRGGFVVHDPVVAGLRPEFRDLFIPRNTDGDEYYGLRWMGFFVQDPATGAVIGQLPHLYPASIAIGYGIDGLTGARRTTGVWAILGVLAVYFAGRWLVGWLPAFSAAALMSLHVIVTWLAKEPNAEVVMLAFLFAGALAFARADEERDGFFGPLAAVLLGLLFFLRFDALLVCIAVVAASLLSWVVKDRAPQTGFVAVFVAVVALGYWYLNGPMRAYMAMPSLWLSSLPPAGVAAGLVAAAGGIVLVRYGRRRWSAGMASLVPGAYVVVLLGAAAYAVFLRQAGGKLTAYDAYALRDFTDYYLTWPALVAAAVGLVIVTRRHFWRAPVLLLAFAAFAVNFFYKIRIVPEHFWASRRFLPVILPMMLLLAATAAVGSWRSAGSRVHGPRVALGLVLVVLLGWHYQAASAPIVNHVEYAGVIPYLERLAGQFTERDLVIIEARDASDMHVLATPLAYTYGTRVLVLASATPDRLRLEAFLSESLRRYDRVLFLGGGGTDLLSRQIIASAIGGDTVQVPEYENASEAYPTRVEPKEFDYSIYELSVGTRPAGPFDLDVGFQDDLNVVRFYAKEETDGRTVRWTGPQSFIAVPGLSGAEREVSMVMHDGGRPAGATAASVDIFFDEVPLGTFTVDPGFATYTLTLPAAAVEAAARRDEPARLRLVSTTWVPATTLGGADTRQLGVMLDRIGIR